MSEVLQNYKIFPGSAKEKFQIHKVLGSSIQKLNLTQISVPTLVSNFEYQKLILELNLSSGSRFSNAGLRIYPVAILDILKKYDTSKVHIEIKFMEEFVLLEDIDLSTLGKYFQNLVLNFNGKMLYKTQFKGGLKRYYVRDGITMNKIKVPNGTKVINNTHNNPIEYY